MTKKHRKNPYDASRADLPGAYIATGNDYIFFEFESMSPRLKGIAYRILSGFRSGHLTKREADEYFRYHAISCMHESDIPY